MKNNIIETRKIIKASVFLIAGLLCLIFLFSVSSNIVSAEPSVKIEIGTTDENSINTDNSPGFFATTVFIALIPVCLMMFTCFTRVIISLYFLKNALGTSDTPPNQVIMGLAVFISIFIMLPVIQEINTSAYEPYKNGVITAEEAISEGEKPLKLFMLKQVYEEDMDMFLSLADSQGSLDMSQYDTKEKLTELSIFVIAPAFVTSELKRAFLIGFLIYIPFLIIDLVVSSTLMAMGMVMLPPAMISMPFKLLLFIVADGWNLMIESLIVSFNHY